MEFVATHHVFLCMFDNRPIRAKFSAPMIDALHPSAVKLWNWWLHWVLSFPLGLGWCGDALMHRHLFNMV